MQSSNPTAAPDPEWSGNYFNYFTEIEEHFQRVRGSGLFLLSPLDWALIESWKVAGVPLESVLQGVDEAFEKWRSRKSKRRQINSLAYCSQAVIEAAGRAPSRAASQPQSSAGLFSADEIRAHLGKAIAALRARAEAPLTDVASSLESISADSERLAAHLEELEQRLTSLEEKLVAALRVSRSDEELLAIRQTLDQELKPYRGKMTADQLSMLERRYVDTALLDRAGVPRLSLFYLH